MALAPQESRLAGWSLLFGTALFSGSLYVRTNLKSLPQFLPASRSPTRILAGARVDASQEVGNDYPLWRHCFRRGLGRHGFSRVPFRKRVSEISCKRKKTYYDIMLFFHCCLVVTYLLVAGVGIQWHVDCLSATIQFYLIATLAFNSLPKYCNKSARRAVNLCCFINYKRSKLLHTSIRPLPLFQQTFVASAYGRSSALSYLLSLLSLFLYFYFRYICTFIFLQSNILEAKEKL